MTCDELELRLPDESDDVQAHLAGCAACRQSTAILWAVAQPPLGPSDKAKLAGLSSAVQSQWVVLQRRRTLAQRFVGLAIAASVGAVVASGLMWKLNGAQPVQAVQPRLEPEVLVLLEDSTLLASDDDSNFEVSWPSLNEDGDVL